MTCVTCGHPQYEHGFTDGAQPPGYCNECRSGDRCAPPTRGFIVTPDGIRIEGYGLTVIDTADVDRCAYPGCGQPRGSIYHAARFTGRHDFQVRQHQDDGTFEAELLAQGLMRRLVDQMSEAVSVGDLFDILDAIEDQCEQVREFYVKEDAAPPRHV